MQGKHSKDSYTEQVHILMPEHINGAGRLFGGRLLAWVDVVAAIVARRHSEHDVTTVSIDHLTFLAPAHENDTIVLTGKITWVGHTSMEVRVDTYIETLHGQRQRVNRAYLVMVAIDEQEKSCAVPSLILDDEEERTAWIAAERRNLDRRARRQEEEA